MQSETERMARWAAARLRRWAKGATGNPLYQRATEAVAREFDAIASAERAKRRKKAGKRGE